MSTSRRTSRFSLGRSLSLCALSTICVYAFFELGAIDMRQVREAFARRWDVLGLNLVCLLGMTVATTARHKWILETLVPVPWSRVTAANVLSAAVAQWAPGSMAVAEVVRGTLLFTSRGEVNDRASFAASLAIVSVVDRALGIGVMFCFGAAAAFAAALSQIKDVARDRLWALSATSLLIGLCFVALPFCADTAPLRALSEKLNRPGARRHGKILNALSAVMVRAASAARCWRDRPSVVVRALLASAVVNVLSPLTYYLSSVALGSPVPLLLVSAILPTTIIGLLLPIGVAGFGGPQLVWAAHFALFNVRPEAVLAMTFVQNTLVLALQSVLGIIWALGYGNRLRHALRSASQPDSLGS